MKTRCLNSNAPNFYAYGGAGIGVDERWLCFDNFYADMGERPKGTSLDRIDNTKGYSKENCRWATPLKQGANKKNNLLITHEGVTKTSAQWATSLGLTKGTVWNRIKILGWTEEKAVLTPKGGGY